MAESIAVWLALNTSAISGGYFATVGQLTAAINLSFAAATLSYGNHQRRKQQRAARDAFNSSVQDRLVMTATAQAARSRVYGRVRNVDGVVFKATHGTNNEFYTLVVALAGHQVDAIEQVWFNDKPLTIDGAGWVQTAPFAVQRRFGTTLTMTVTGGAGSLTLPSGWLSTVAPIATIEGPDGFSYSIGGTVSGGVFSVTGAVYDGTYTVMFQEDYTESKARVRLYTGAPGQNLYGDLTALVGAAVGPSDRFEGFAAALVTLQYDQDAFADGVPNISAVMRGARVFDPRTSTTAWTANPALIARDWSLYSSGGGCTTSELNEASFLAAANACDVTTTFALPTGGPVVAPLYECGIVIPLDANPDEALSEICESMAGQWGWAGGRLSVRAGAYRAPVATITEDWLAGTEALQVQPGAGQAEALNIMRPTYADAAQGYVQTPGAEVRADAYVTADGRELVSEIQLGGVTRSVHAQHVCGVLLREAREGLTVTLPCNLRAYPLELFDVVSVTLPRFGWSAKLFEVTGWRFGLAGGVLLTLRETAAAIYTPDAVFDTLNISPNTNLPQPSRPPAITGLAATSGGAGQTDGSSLARIRVTWDPVASEAVRQSGAVEVQVAEVPGGLPAGDWPGAVTVAGRATSADVVGQRIGRLVAIRARAVNTLGQSSPWRQITHTVAGRRAPIVWRQAAAPTGASVQDQDEWIDTDDGNRRYLRQAGAWVDVRDAAANTAIVYLFRRAGSTPAVPAGTLTYTFATNALSGSLDGWTTTVPAGSDPVYVTVATASSANATDSIAPGEWAAPVVLAANGAPGAPGATGSTGPAGAAGTNAATVYLFQRTSSATAPALPSASVTYTFASGGAAGVNNGWLQSLPTTGGAYRWVTTATALGTGATDTIAAGEWAAASLLAEDGAPGATGPTGPTGPAGAAGINTAIVYLFRRAGSTPAVPAGTLTYTFATNALSGSLDGWTTTVPAGSDPVYVTVATASSANATDTIASGEWAAPVVLAANGAAGAPGATGSTGPAGAAGTNAATVYLFQRTGSATAPALPSASVTYTFASGGAAGVNNGWQQSLPTTGGAYRWVTTATALGTGATDTIAAGEWAAASLLAEDGAPGATGPTGPTGPTGSSVYTAIIYSTAATLPSAPSGGTYNFSTSVLTPPSGWQTGVPAASDAGSWQTSFTFVGSTPTSTVTAGTWGTVSGAPRAAPTDYVVTPGRYVYDSGVSGIGGAATAAIRFVAGGAIARATNTAGTTFANFSTWFVGTVGGATYYIRFTTRSTTGGSVTGSNTGWLALTSDRTVSLSVTAFNTGSALIDYQIAADAGGSNVLATGVVDLYAESTT